MGEETPAGPWNELSLCAPEDSYGRSKRDAETAVMNIGQKSNLEVDAIHIALKHPNAKDQTYLVSDGEDTEPIEGAGLPNLWTSFHLPYGTEACSLWVERCF